MFRFIEPQPRPGERPGPEHCRACGAVTREGKPFCPKHVDGMPYVQDVMMRVAALERAAAALRNGSRLSPDSPLVHEAVRVLLAVGGSITASRLSRELGALGLKFGEDLAWRLCKQIARMGLVTLGKTNRGGSTVTLLKKEGGGSHAGSRGGSGGDL